MFIGNEGKASAVQLTFSSASACYYVACIPPMAVREGGNKGLNCAPVIIGDGRGHLNG